MATRIFWGSHQRRRLLPCPALLVTVLAVLPACGGGGGGYGGGGGVTTPTPVRTLVGQQNFTLVSTAEANSLGLLFDAYRVEFTTGATGTLEVIADWTFASNDIDIQVSRPPCVFATFYADACSKVGEAVSFTQKPERLTVANVAAGNYVLYIYGVAITAESGNLQIYVTH